MRIAVVGGGISGLMCARALADRDCEVVVFEQGRSVGGRLTTRRSRDPGSPAFDLGAPMFRVTDERFAGHVGDWIDAGVCSAWRPRAGRWDGDRVFLDADAAEFVVGTPGMDAVCQHLASALEVRSSTAVTALSRVADGWSLSVRANGQESACAAGTFDAVVVAAAAAQSARLVSGVSPSIAGALSETGSRPIWILKAELSDPLDGLPDVLRVGGDFLIEKIVRDDAKPGRSGAEGLSRVVVHARSEWSGDRYDADPREIAGEMAGSLSSLLAGVCGVPLATDRFVRTAAHRWGLARAGSLCDQACAFDRGSGLVVCGDGFRAAAGEREDLLEDGVQNAFLSGIAAAERVLSLRGA